MYEGSYTKVALVTGAEKLCVLVCGFNIQDRQFGFLLGETFWSRKQNTDSAYDSIAYDLEKTRLWDMSELFH